jgi:hypothetical protein
VTVRPAAIASSILAIRSIAVAIWIRMYTQCVEHDVLAYGLVGAWALGLPSGSSSTGPDLSPKTKDDFDQLKYSQKLAATVWVALVVVLAAITGIKWGG